MRDPGENGAEVVKARIERCFRQIETDRMAEIPILNRALRVEVVGLQRLGGEWLSILVTPWFMNVMLLPAEQSDPAQRVAVGAKTQEAFPSGRYEMIGGFEAGLGSYRMCSLFSPVLEFADHDSAVLAAEAALVSLLASDAADDTDAQMSMIWRGERPAVAQGEELSVAGQIEDQPAAADCVPCLEDSGPGSAFSRRGLLLGRLRAEDRSER